MAAFRCCSLLDRWKFEKPTAATLTLLRLLLHYYYYYCYYYYCYYYYYISHHSQTQPYHCIAIHGCPSLHPIVTPGTSLTDRTVRRRCTCRHSIRSSVSLVDLRPRVVTNCCRCIHCCCCDCIPSTPSRSPPCPTRPLSPPSLSRPPPAAAHWLLPALLPPLTTPQRIGRLTGRDSHCRTSRRTSATMRRWRST